MATTSSEEIANVLIGAKKGHLEQTFKTYEKGQVGLELSDALVIVAVQGHSTIVADCLRMAYDPRPDDVSSVNPLVNNTLARISGSPINTDSFTNVITSFNPEDIKPLVSIRLRTISRHDVVDVLKRIMVKYDTLIIDYLPNWLASHPFDRISDSSNGTAREEAFHYLASFATESILNQALSILAKNEHYEIAFGGTATTRCCRLREYFPQGLFDRINVLLKIVKARNAVIDETLVFLPSVLVKLVLDYAPNDTA